MKGSLLTAFSNAGRRFRESGDMYDSLSIEYNTYIDNATQENLDKGLEKAEDSWSKSGMTGPC
eukprot:4998747-Prorocentrum_lima.AAC.1